MIAENGALLAESRFLNCFDRRAVVRVLEGSCPDFRGLHINLFEPVGCDECTEGYKGRTGIYQVMPMTDDIAAIVLQGGNAMDIADAAQKIGINDLRQSALLKAAQGTTSLAEINRVTKD